MSYQGTSPQIGTHKKLDNLAFDGVTTSFVLSAFGSPVFPAIAEALLISLNGVLQEPNGSFTVSGSNITFSSAPAIGTSFFGVLLGEKVLLADVLAASGGTMTGLLLLSANPTAALGAATKQYVDSGVSSVSTVKQDVLVSGTNIKTINGDSVLGSGDIQLSQSLESTDLIIDVEEQLNIAVPLQTSLSNSSQAIQSVVSVDSTREVIILGGYDGTGSLHAVAYNKSTKTFGAAVLLRSGVTTGITVQAALIESNKIVVCSSTGIATFSTVVLTLSGTSISVGTAVDTSSNSGSTITMSYNLPLVVGTTMVVRYAVASMGNTAFMRAITVSGSTPSVGSEFSDLTAHTDGKNFPMSITDQGNILTLCSTSSQMSAYVIGVSGNTLSTLANGNTPLSNQVMGSTAPILRKLSTGRYGFVWTDGTASYGSIIDAVPASFSISTKATLAFAGDSSIGAISIGPNMIFAVTSGTVCYYNVLTDSAGTAVAGTEANLTGYSAFGYSSSELLLRSTGTFGLSPSYIAIGAVGGNPVISYFDTNRINSSADVVNFSGFNQLTGTSQNFRSSTGVHISPPSTSGTLARKVTPGSKSELIWGTPPCGFTYNLKFNETEAWTVAHFGNTSIVLRKVKIV